MNLKKMCCDNGSNNELISSILKSYTDEETGELDPAFIMTVELYRKEWSRVFKSAYLENRMKRGE